MVLLLLTIVRNDILSEWRQSLPEDAPNYFMLNIEPEDWDGISSLLAEELGEEPEFLRRLHAVDSILTSTPLTHL